MFDIAWCDKYDLSVLCLYFVNSLVSGEHCRTYFYKKETFVTFNITIRMCDDIWEWNS